MVPALRRWALQKGELDRPDERKVHKDPVPRLGGIAIFMAFLFSVLVFVDMTCEVRGILAGSLVIFFTGLIDDLHGLSPRRKFFGQISGCLVTMSISGLHLGYLGDLFGTGSIILPFWIAIPFTIFAVVGVINAVNLIDGLDGLAGGVAFISLAAFLLLAHLTGNFPVMLLCAAMLGAVLGFLKYNFWPARIFMGDGGSLTIGFILAFLAIHLTQASGGAISPVIPVIILGLPIIDTLRVMTRRALLERKSPFSPDRTHLHHQFLDLGIHHRTVVLLIYGISLTLAAVPILFRSLPEYALLLSYLGTSVLFFSLPYFIRRLYGRFRPRIADSGSSVLVFRRWAAHLRLESILIFLVAVVFGFASFVH